MHMLYVRTYKKHIFAHWLAFSSGHRSFLALSAAGHAVGSPVHYGAMMPPGPAPCTLGACSGRSKLSELDLNHGIAFRDDEPPTTMEIPQLQLFVLLLLNHTAPPALKISTLRQAQYNSSRHIKLFPLWRPRTVLFCVRVCHDSCRSRKHKRTHNFKSGAHIAGAGRY